jgi:hypothetical protein
MMQASVAEAALLAALPLGEGACSFGSGLGTLAGDKAFAPSSTGDADARK